MISANRRRVEAIAGIVDLRAIGNDEDHVHVRGDIDIISRRRNSVDNGEIAGRVDRNVHEEIQIGDDVALGQSVFRQLENEVLAAGMLISGLFAEAHRIALAGAAARRRVVLPAGIRGDPRHHPSLVRDKLASRGRHKPILEHVAYPGRYSAPPDFPRNRAAHRRLAGPPLSIIRSVCPLIRMRDHGLSAGTSWA